MITAMGFAYYNSAIIQYEEEHPIIEGSMIYEFEHFQFVPCQIIESLEVSQVLKYQDGMDIDNYGQYEKQHYLHSKDESDPVYIKFRGKISETGGSSWMGYDYEIEVIDLIDMKNYEDRPCEPLTKPFVIKRKPISAEERAKRMFNRLKREIP